MTSQYLEVIIREVYLILYSFDHENDIGIFGIQHFGSALACLETMDAGMLGC